MEPGDLVLELLVNILGATDESDQSEISNYECQPIRGCITVHLTEETPAP